MADVKDPQAVHSEAVSSNSDIDDTEKAGRNSIAGHKENLEDLDDPDAGKTAEERAAIVCVARYVLVRNED